MMKRLLPLVAALPLAACISFGEEPPPTLMTLTPSTMVENGSTRSSPPGQAISILTPGAPQELGTVRVPVRASDTSVAYLKDAQWVEAPTRLFRALLAEVVSARTGRVVIGPRQLSLDPGIRLSGDLKSFGLDGPSNTVIVVYEATLQRQEGKEPETRRFEAKVPVTRAEAQPVAIGLNTAANQIAIEVADWIGR